MCYIRILSMNNVDIIPYILGAISGWISVALTALAIIPQTIRTFKTKDSNFGSLITFSIYGFSGLCYLLASILILSFKMQVNSVELDVNSGYWYWAWLFYLVPIFLDTIGPVCSTLIVIFILKEMIRSKKTKLECKNDISGWTVSFDECKKAKGFSKIVLFFRTIIGFILISVFFLLGLIMMVCLFIFTGIGSDGDLTTNQLVLLLLFNSVGAITWTIINWPLFFSTYKKEKIAKISLWYILFNTVSALILLIYGIVVMFAVGWAPITIFGCIFNGSGSSILILYRKIKLMNSKE